MDTVIDIDCRISVDISRNVSTLTVDLDTRGLIHTYIPMIWIMVRITIMAMETLTTVTMAMIMAVVRIALIILITMTIQY